MATVCGVDRMLVDAHMPFPLSTEQEIAFQWVQLIAPVVGTALAFAHTHHFGMALGTLAISTLFGVATALGVTVGFHRLFTHRSFETVRPIRAALAILGSMAAQGTLFSWIASHRQHHQHSDHDGDPHSPNVAGDTLRGRLLALAHSHLGWMLTGHMTPERMRYIPDLMADTMLCRIQRLHFVWVALGFILPACLCYWITGTWQAAVGGLLWGGFVRIAVTDQVSFAVNSVCHLWGKRPFESDDQSRNNAVMALLALGEGWHNNHHAFPTSARHGLGRWQFDASYRLIQVLCALGLAWNVKTPTAGQIESRVRPVPVNTTPTPTHEAHHRGCEA